jgi:hypothetical protein
LPPPVPSSRLAPAPLAPALLAASYLAAPVPVQSVPSTASVVPGLARRALWAVILFRMNGRRLVGDRSGQSTFVRRFNIRKVPTVIRKVGSMTPRTVIRLLALSILPGTLKAQTSSLLCLTIYWVPYDLSMES